MKGGLYGQAVCLACVKPWVQPTPKLPQTNKNISIDIVTRGQICFRHVVSLQPLHLPSIPTTQQFASLGAELFSSEIPYFQSDALHSLVLLSALSGSSLSMCIFE